VRGLIFPDILGGIGVATIVITYILLQSEKVRSDGLAYSVMNASGAALILVSLWFSPNLPSVIVESFWLLISLYGIAKNFSKK
jgi:hypothetical protein